MASVATMPIVDPRCETGAARMQVLGWLVVIAAVITAYVFYRRSTVPAAPGTPAPPNRAVALGAAVIAVVLALMLFNAAPPSVAQLKPVYTEDFSQDPTRHWYFNVPSQV